MPCHIIGQGDSKGHNKHLSHAKELQLQNNLDLFHICLFQNNTVYVSVSANMSCKTAVGGVFKDHNLKIVFTDRKTKCVINFCFVPIEDY